MKNAKKKLRYSIRLKAITMIVVLALIIIEIAVAYYSIMMNKVNQETYRRVAKDISASAALTVEVEDVKYLKGLVDPRVEASETKPLAESSTQEELDAYYVQFADIENDAKFKNTKEFLGKFVTTNADFLECLYIQYAHKDDLHEFVVYLVDTDETETACKPGYLDPIHDDAKSMLTNPKGQIEAHVIKTDRYGWLMTAGTPIMDGENVVAYVMADISMASIRSRQSSSILRLFIYMLTTLILLGIVGTVWVSLWMIRPLKKLISATQEYDSDDPKGTHEKIQALNIKTRDEIGDLSESFKAMEQDVYERYTELLETNHQLIASREETKKMEMLANQDGLTGVHNKIAYNSEVKRINKQIEDGEKVNFAIVMVDLNYLKDTNDSFGHDTGDVALIKLASVICDIFKLSPVYRVGGDEFVVICRGKDYQKVDQHVIELKRLIAKSIKNKDAHDAENISAAVGYSSFNLKTDKVVDDVFKRADRAMYENKHEIKKLTEKL